jgi:cell division septal protein FtsQ
VRPATAAGARLAASAAERAAQLPVRLRRRLLIGAAALLALASIYLLWARDAPFVRVERVSVTGLTTSDAARLRQALTAAAKGMTTLHVRHDRLDRVTAAYPVVQGLEVDADFPNTLRVHVIEHRPVAIAVGRGGRVPLAADGRPLRGIPADRTLPVVKLAGALPSERLRERAAMRAVRVLATAPKPLARRLQEARQKRGRGVVVSIRRGPELVFGEPTRLRAKWVAAARVLADPASRGAIYLDLRLPERPVAGGLPVETVVPVAPAGTPTSPVQPRAAQPPERGPAGAPAQPAPARPAPPQQGPQPAPQNATQPPRPAPTQPGGGAVANPQP